MNIYPYQLDQQALEIFPQAIFRDPYVVFHGTSAYHSPDIESNGFLFGKGAFDLDKAIDLLNLLKNPMVSQFDLKDRWGMTRAFVLESYINAIQSGKFRLSFSYLSYACVPFATGSSKGGQALNHIIESRKIINQAAVNNPSVNGLVGQSITDLFNFVPQIQNADGVVYAIRLDQSLAGIEMGTGVIHATQSIPREAIIGKVILPNDININQFSLNEVSEKHKRKLFHSPTSLGILLTRKNYAPQVKEEEHPGTEI